MKNILKSGLMLAVAVFLAMSAHAQAGIQFHQGTYQEALNKASKENKVVFMDAYTSWCGPCRAMAANTFTNPEVAEYFNKNFLNVKMDMEKGEGPVLGRKYAVNAYPTLLFLNGEGSVVHREMGFKDANTLINIGKKVMAARPASAN